MAVSHECAPSNRTNGILNAFKAALYLHMQLRFNIVSINNKHKIFIHEIKDDSNFKMEALCEAFDTVASTRIAPLKLTLNSIQRQLKLSEVKNCTIKHQKILLTV